ncbi:MAG: O-antigen ligase family protein, partial [Candidatus Omnitrophica bacterium]|nr:O-antigen ligase family protein [Candidatus Omnitrophota bacterium]
GVRLDILKDSLKMFKDYPIFGVGWGNFHYLFSQYRTFIGRAEYYRMHNELLQIVLETGILGGFFFLSFLFLTLKKIIQKTLTRHDPFTRNIVFSGIAGILGLIIHSCSELDFHVPAIVIVLWIFLGIFYRCAFTKLEP